MAHQATVQSAGLPVNAPADRTWAAQPPRGGWRALRRGLVAGWVLLSAFALVLGEHHSSWSRLQYDVAAGDVHVVRMAGDLSRGGTGFAVVELHWRRGPVRYETEVIEARPRRQDLSEADDSGVTAVLGESATAQLQRIRPTLQIQHVARLSSSVFLLGRRVPGWAGMAGLALALLSLGLLVAGPDPWRATRWGWFWLIGVAPPVGMLAFLALSGPTPLVPAPPPGARKLRGGWAFVLGVVLTSVLGGSL